MSADIATPQPTAAELAQTLAELKERRTALDNERLTTFTEHEQARAALITGAPDAVDRVTALHARSLALTEAYEAVDRQIAELQAAHDATQREERRAALAAQLVPLAARAKEHQEAFTALQQQANDMLQDLVAKCLAEVDALIACRQEFIDLLTPIVSVYRGSLSLESEEGRAALADGNAVLAAAQAEGADLSALLVRRVGSPMTPFDQQPTPPAPIEPHGWAISTILGRMLQQREQEKQRAYEASIREQFRANA